MSTLRKGSAWLVATLTLALAGTAAAAGQQGTQSSMDKRDSHMQGMSSQTMPQHMGNKPSDRQGMHPGMSDRDANASAAQEDDMQKLVFDRLDTNHDGKISRSEALHDRGVKADFRKIDRDHNGSLSAQEFASYEPGSYQASATSTRHKSSRTHTANADNGSSGSRSQ